MTEVPDTIPKSPALQARPELHPELRNWCDAWNACLQNVLSQVSGQPTVFEASSEPLPLADSDVWYTVVAGGAVRGEMTLRLPSASAVRLARKFLGETEAAVEAVAAKQSAPEQITPEQKEALEELLRQIAGLAATAIAATAGGEVQLHLSSSSAPSWSSDAIVGLKSNNETDAGASIEFEIQLSPALAAALQSRPQTAAPARPSALTSPPSSPPSSGEMPSSSYRRLMDVGLDVKLRFGTRRMLLRDVLALSAGVVVELDNHLHSPVDLLLDGRLIAQGDVVVVDGKYGLRVTDVVDPPPALAFPV